MAGPALPTNLTTGTTGHVGHSNSVHKIVNTLDTAIGTATPGQVLTWNGAAYAPAAAGTSSAAVGVRPESFYKPGDVNDGEAIQRALDSTPKGVGVTLQPFKTYVSTRQIVVHDQILYGNGATISGGSSFTNLTLNGKNPGIRDLHVVAHRDNVVGVNIGGDAYNPTIIGGSIGGVQGVSINSAGIKHVLIQNVHFQAATYGVLTNQNATDLQGVRIIGCLFDDISGDAIEFNHPGSAGTGGRELVVSGNSISCRAFSDTSGLPGPPSAGFGVGIAHCNNVAVTGNTFFDCRQQGVHIEDTAAQVTVTGNTFRNCNEAIWAIGCDTLAISGNTIIGGSYGIHCTYDATHYVQRVTATGNTIAGTKITAAVFETNRDPLVVFVGNMVTNNTGKGLVVSAPTSGVRYIVANNLINGNKGAATTFTGAAGTVTSNITS